MILIAKPKFNIRGVFRVIRGGCWASHVPHCRSMSRGQGESTARRFIVGFRTVLRKRGA